MHTTESFWKRVVGYAGVGSVVLAVGCSQGSQRVQITDISDGTYLRGSQVATLDVHDARDAVMRSELYLDGLRVAADDFAPFELGWDTREFADGAHDLTARVYFADGNYDEGAVAILIDNTPPSVDAVPTTAVGNTAFAVTLSDNLKVARLEVSRDVPGEPPIILTEPPFTFPWAWGCGTSTLHVRVFDAAGSDASVTADVTATDAFDLDCDGFRSVAEGGTDCDDFTAAIHPGAPEPPEGFDLDCDGVVASLAGVDSDGDGVPSFADGGSDCDDTDPAIHGDFFQFAHIPVTVGGVQLTWNPGEAVLEAGPNFWRLYLDRDGAITMYSPGPGADAVADPIATGANASSLSVYAGVVAYGRGSDIVIVQRNLGTWEQVGVIHASAPVGKLFVDTASNGVAYAVFQAGTDLWFASSADAKTWTIEHIDDAHEPLIDNPSGYAFPPLPLGGMFAFRTAHAVLTYGRGPGQPFRRQSLRPAGEVITAVSHDAATVIAVENGAGSTVYLEVSDQPVLTLATRVTGLSVHYPSLFVQTEGSDRVEVYLLSGTPRPPVHVQSLPGIAPFDVTAFDGFAGNGTVHVLGAGSVAAPADLPTDHVDRNCDGRD